MAQEKHLTPQKGGSQPPKELLKDLELLENLELLKMMNDLKMMEEPPVAKKEKK